jgi:hypothetical protein
MPQSMRSIHICLEPHKTERLWTETIDGDVTIVTVFGCFFGGSKSNVSRN